MKKLRKSLAVLLAVIMLATFMPLFASAAVTINRTNVKIVPPSVSPTEINYGQTLADVTLTGGECWYVDPDTGTETLVPGHFEHRSTTTTPNVSDAYAIALKFVSDDTTAYSNISTLLKSGTTLKSGTWPTIKVKGAQAVLVEAPTAAALTSGNALRKATLSGGIVHDKDGNVVSGKWSYVYPSSYPAATGNYDVQFQATGYETLYTTVNVTVTPTYTATMTEAPTAKRMIKGATLNGAKIVGGKIVDGEGTEITGTWRIVNDASQKASDIILNETGTFTYKAQWVKAGYPVIVVDIPIIVAEDKGYEFTKEPTINAEILMVENMTYADVPINAGEATIPGTYSLKSPTTQIKKAQEYTVTIVFTPDDLSYVETTFSATFKVVKDSSWANEMIAGVEKIVLPYNFPNSFISNTQSWFPAEYADVCSQIFWDERVYNSEGRDPGDIQLVNVTYTPVNAKVNGWGYDQIYIQIAPSNHTGDLGKFTAVPQDYSGEIIIRLSIDIPGISGTAVVKQGETVIGEFTPNENGKIYEAFAFKAPADGAYTFTVDYIPGVLDKVNVANTHMEASAEIDITLPVSVFYYNAEGSKKENSQLEKSVVSAVMNDSSGYKAEDVEYWEVTDENGKALTLYDVDGNIINLNQAKLYNVVIPDGVKEVHFYAHGPWDDEIIISGSDDMGTTFVKLWQKLVNFIIEIYRTIVDFFVPAMENV